MHFFLRKIAVTIGVFLSAAALPIFAQQAVQLVAPPGKAKAAGKAEASGILPSQFSGWQSSAKESGTNPALADAANAAVLKEYGFQQFERATYTRDERKLEIKAARFADAGGAY